MKPERKYIPYEKAVKILSEYKYLQEIKAKTDRMLKDLKEEIQTNLVPGQYDEYLLAFEIREVREYTVPSRIDHIVKVHKI